MRVVGTALLTAVGKEIATYCEELQGYHDYKLFKKLSREALKLKSGKNGDSYASWYRKEDEKDDGDGKDGKGDENQGKGEGNEGGRMKGPGAPPVRGMEDDWSMGGTDMDEQHSFAYGREKQEGMDNREEDVYEDGDAEALYEDGDEIEDDYYGDVGGEGEDGVFMNVQGNVHNNLQSNGPMSSNDGGHPDNDGQGGGGGGGGGGKEGGGGGGGGKEDGEEYLLCLLDDDVNPSEKTIVALSTIGIIMSEALRIRRDTAINGSCTFSPNYDPMYLPTYVLLTKGKKPVQLGKSMQDRMTVKQKNILILSSAAHVLLKAGLKVSIVHRVMVSKEMRVKSTLAWLIDVSQINDGMVSRKHYAQTDRLKTDRQTDRLADKHTTHTDTYIHTDKHIYRQPDRQIAR